MIRPPGRYWAALAMAVALLIAIAVLLGSISDLHDRFARQSPWLGAVFLGLVAVGAVGAGAWVFIIWHRSRAPAPQTVAPEDTVSAARAQAEAAVAVIGRIENPAIKTELERELALLTTGARPELRVVLFGTGSAGKTSLASALLGRESGHAAAVVGTTLQAASHTYHAGGPSGLVLLTDTPGLAEIGAGGANREREARELAVRADLLVFVVDHDLIRGEYEPLSALARQGKRSLVFLNKTDRFTEPDRDAILAKLRERLRGVVAAEDVIAGAAAPRPLMVRRTRPDGATETAQEPRQPEIEPLRARIAAILNGEGESLHAGNLLLRAHLLARRAQDQVALERDLKAQAVVERFQWITAATVFANPFPAIELVAGGAVQLQMISELAAVYDVPLSQANVRMIGGQMIQTLLKLGLLETTTSLIAGVFKSSLVGYAAGGAVQAVSLAYLTHVSGAAFSAFFRRGQTWGDGGLQAELIRQFDLTSRVDFLQEFARQALRHASDRLIGANRERPK